MRARWRTPRTCSARPWWTTNGVRWAIPLWWCWWWYQWKRSRKIARAWSPDAKRTGIPGRYLRVLKWASEYGLSLETWGRLWLGGGAGEAWTGAPRRPRRGGRGAPGG